MNYEIEFFHKELNTFLIFKSLVDDIKFLIKPRLVDCGQTGFKGIRYFHHCGVKGLVFALNTGAKQVVVTVLHFFAYFLCAI